MDLAMLQTLDVCQGKPIPATVFRNVLIDAGYLKKGPQAEAVVAQKLRKLAQIGQVKSLEFQGTTYYVPAV